ncbi:hypothetical protein COO60DRAFT_505557 [Scenedesmus sp. NREL 46B-D3]|nr:hypothetical protein COO60DRAFT_505557 [Scenedesmus sp. NREL 46B-D3]
MRRERCITPAFTHPVQHCRQLRCARLCRTCTKPTCQPGMSDTASSACRCRALWLLGGSACGPTLVIDICISTHSFQKGPDIWYIPHHPSFNGLIVRTKPAQCGVPAAREHHVALFNATPQYADHETQWWCSCTMQKKQHCNSSCAAVVV